MDWVFREYSNPFSLLDSLIISNRFSEWVDEFAKSHNEKLQWDAWLHKDFEHKWDEVAPTEAETMTNDEMKSIIQDTKSMLNGYELEMR